MLLRDNFSAPRSNSNIPHCSNIAVKCLSSSATSRIQHLGAGIIAPLLRYSAFHIECGLGLIYQNVKYTYKVDILSAMRVIKI